jgi:hypothetical protein
VIRGPGMLDMWASMVGDVFVLYHLLFLFCVKRHMRGSSLGALACGFRHEGWLPASTGGWVRLGSLASCVNWYPQLSVRVFLVVFELYMLS